MGSRDAYASYERVGYFECSDAAVGNLTQGAERVAAESSKRSPRFSIKCHGVATDKYGNGADSNSIYLDFDQSDSNHPLITLRRDALRMVDELSGATMPAASDYRHKINLIEHADLASAVMDDALDFARGVAIDVGVPAVASAWRLVLLRYHSESAGDDWSNGSWASDISWEYLSSFVL